MSIKDYFIKLVIKKISSEYNINVSSSEKIKHMKISEMPITVATQVSPNCIILKLIINVEIHIYYWLKTNDIDSTLVLQQNSFTILM